MDLFGFTSAKYLSVRQPWAHLIVEGVKPVENRPWSTTYRGPLLIHASLNPSATPLAQINARYGLALAPDQFRFGGIVGVVTLTNIVRAHPSPFFDGPTTTDTKGKTKANYGLLFTRPQRLPFFPMRGALMIRPAPADALALYREELAMKVGDFVASESRDHHHWKIEGETDSCLAPPTLMTCRCW